MYTNPLSSTGRQEGQGNLSFGPGDTVAHENMPVVNATLFAGFFLYIGHPRYVYTQIYNELETANDERGAYPALDF